SESTPGDSSTLHRPRFSSSRRPFSQSYYGTTEPIWACASSSHILVKVGNSYKYSDDCFIQKVAQVRLPARFDGVRLTDSNPKHSPEEVRNSRTGFRTSPRCRPPDQ